MSERREYMTGEVCRADLQVQDVAAARSFYARVCGWSYEDLPAPGGRICSMTTPVKGPVAVIAPQFPQEASGATAQWSISFAADDAETIAGEAAFAGGKLQSGPEVMPDGGVFARLAAPGGGTLGVWQAGTVSSAGGGSGPGTLAWAELLTSEPQAAVGFFQQLFGHDVTEYPQDDGGTYTTLMANGTEVAGILPAGADDGGTAGDSTETGSPGTGSARWQVYFSVRDVAAAVGTAVAAGAVLLMKPEDITGDGGEGGIVATLQDPEGAMFSLVQVQDEP